jgi:hypothetical protein
MNGADYSTDPYRSWLRFWPIEDWIPAEGLPPPHGVPNLPGKPFILADFGWECVHYVIELDCLSTCYGGVYALGDTHTVQVSKSFTDFIDMVLGDSKGLHAYF